MTRWHYHISHFHNISISTHSITAPLHTCRYADNYDTRVCGASGHVHKGRAPSHPQIMASLAPDTCTRDSMYTLMYMSSCTCACRHAPDTYDTIGCGAQWARLHCGTLAQSHTIVIISLLNTVHIPRTYTHVGTRPTTTTPLIAARSGRATRWTCTGGTRGSTSTPSERFDHGAVQCIQRWAVLCRRAYTCKCVCVCVRHTHPWV